MKILVINTGSSSIKYELFDMTCHRIIVQGMVEKIGEDNSLITHRRHMSGGETLAVVEEVFIEDHFRGLRCIVDFITSSEHGVLDDCSEISAIGHRVVHGGERFHEPTVIDGEVMDVIRANIPLAPLHNPANLMGIEVASSIFQHSLQVAVFDTAFHQTMPERAFLYALPLELYRDARVRRYGFHGTSHSYVSEKAAEYLMKSLSSLSIITVHLGNGASMAAIKGGVCIDTSMGMTPLEGLVMGTRCGDIDPAIPFFLSKYRGVSFEDIDDILNSRSGLRGMCGANDMREVLDRRHRGDKSAAVAIDVYTYRIKKYIGAYFAAMGSLDAIIFTAGIGENSPEIRELCCGGLEGLGIEIDSEKNRGCSGMQNISSGKSRVSVLVIPTSEELKIAIETMKVFESVKDICGKP